MKLDIRTFTLLLCCWCLADSSQGLAQETGQNQKKNLLKKGPNVAISISNRHKTPPTTYFNLGLFSNYDKLSGWGTNVISNVVQEHANGVQISGLANISGGHTSGLALSGFANVSGENMNGLALSGLMNVSGKKANGLQISGLGNIGGNQLNGLSIGGLINLSGRNSSGMQIAGLSNIARNTLRGVAVSGLMNVSGGSAYGLQLTTLLNVAGRSNRGVQLAGLGNVNVTNKGLQLAFANYSEENNGLQAGVANVNNRGKRGLQLGFINISTDSLARQIGCINLKPQTRVQFLVSGGNANKFNAAVRFKNKYTYTQIGAGAYYLNMNQDFSFSGFYRAGLYYPLMRKLEISGDIGYYHIETLNNKHAGIPARLYAIQPRLNIEYSITRKFGIFASGGYGWTRSYHGEPFENKGIFEVGVVLF